MIRAAKRTFKETPRIFGSNPNAHTTCEIYFYGITGQKLATYTCQLRGPGKRREWELHVHLAGRNEYFAGKPIKLNGVAVVTDRLGSVRWNGNGERFNYYPYGEERGRRRMVGRSSVRILGMRLGWITRISGITIRRRRGLRRRTPLNSNAVELTGNWNRMAYVGGDPINRTDPSGLCSPDDSPPCYSATGTGSMPGSGPSSLWCSLWAVSTEATLARATWFARRSGNRGGGFVQVQPKVPGGNNYTPAQMQGLTNGLNNALSHTDQVDCATFYAGGDDDPSLAVANDLENTLYRLLPLPQGPGTGAQTIDLTNVMINTAGAFFNAGANANGTVTVGMPNGAGVQAAFTFANMSTFQGFILLHELGHQTGVFGPDVDAAANGTNSQAVLDHCFKTDAQGVWH